MNNSTKLLIALFVVLAALAAYYIIPSGKEREASYKTSEMNLSIDSATVTKIDILRSGKSITLENTGGRWMLISPLSFPANASSVTQLISSFSKFKVGTLVSSNPEKQNMFQVDSTGTTVTFTHRSGKSVSLVVGKMGPSYSEVYFRLPESKDVYLGDGMSPWTVTQEVKEWRDKTIFSTSSDSIKEVSMEYKSKSYVFHRDSTEWKFGDQTLAAGDMSTMLSTLSNLRADDFIDSSFAPPTNPLSVKVHTSEDVVLNFFPQLPDSAKYVVQSSQSPQMFVLSKWTVQQIRKPLEKYVK